MLKLFPADPQTKKHFMQLRKRIVDLIQSVVEKMFASKKTIQKIDSRLLSSLLVSVMDGLILKYSFLNKKINSEK